MFFECEYCKTKFKNPVNFKKHLCEKKQKFLLLNDKIGKIAYICYQDWRQIKGFYSPSKEIFLNSKFFKSFINFVHYCQEKSIPDRKGFIKLMVEKSVEPSLWLNDQYYDYYIEHFDELYSPVKQIEISLEYMYKISKLLNYDISEVIQYIPIIDLLKLIVCKKISPWLLLFMKSFETHIAFGITEEDRILIDSVIIAEEWQKKIINNQESVEKIKKLMNSLNI